MKNYKNSCFYGIKINETYYIFECSFFVIRLVFSDLLSF